MMAFSITVSITKLILLVSKTKRGIELKEDILKLIFFLRISSLCFSIDFSTIFLKEAFLEEYLLASFISLIPTIKSTISSSLFVALFRFWICINLSSLERLMFSNSLLIQLIRVKGVRKV